MNKLDEFLWEQEKLVYQINCISRKIGVLTESNRLYKEFSGDDNQDLIDEATDMSKECYFFTKKLLTNIKRELDKKVVYYRT